MKLTCLHKEIFCREKTRAVFVNPEIPNNEPEAPEETVPMAVKVARLKLATAGKETLNGLMASLTGYTAEEMLGDKDNYLASMTTLSRCVEKKDLTHEQCRQLLLRSGLPLDYFRTYSRPNSEEQLDEQDSPRTSTPSLDESTRALSRNPFLQKNPKTKDRVVRAWSILRNNPTWEEVIQKGIADNPILLPDGRKVEIPLELVLGVMMAESGGKNSKQDQSKFKTPEGKIFGTTAVGAMGTMAGHPGARRFFEEKIASGELQMEYKGEIMSEERFNKMPRHQKTKFIINAIGHQGELAVEEGVRHLSEKIASYNRNHRKNFVDPTNPNDAGMIYLIFNSGEGGADAIAQYAKNPTAKNRARLPAFAKWKDQKKPGRDIALARYNLSLAVGKIVKGCMRVNTPEYYNHLAVITDGYHVTTKIAHATKTPASAVVATQKRTQRERIANPTQYIDAERTGYIASLKPYVDDNGRNRAEIMIIHNAYVKGTETVARDNESEPRKFYRTYDVAMDGASPEVKTFLDRATFDNQKNVWVLANADEKIWVEKGRSLGYTVTG